MSRRAWSPAVSARTRLAGAALIWSGVGIGLCAAGLRWSLEAAGPSSALAIGSGLALGMLKGRFLLAPRAKANADRIERAGDARCVGGLFSWSAWIFVATMLALGAFLRASGIPKPVLGLLYVAVGTALLTGSIASWRRYTASRRPEDDRTGSGT